MSGTIAESIAGELHAAGIRYLFGHPGGEVVELIQACEKAGIRFVLMGHESAAALAAGTLGQATGVPGACLATLGPGACNLVLGVADALLDRHPLLALSARTAVNVEGWFSHQNIPLNDLFAPISKNSIALDGENTRRTIQQALQFARTPPRGPVYLTLPADLAEQTDTDRSPHGNGPARGDAQPEHDPTPNSREYQDSLGKIQQALNQARRPIAVVGIALDYHQDPGPIRAFLAKTGLPYLDTPKTKGLVDPYSPAYLGTCLSASGDALITQFIQDRSDFLLGIGFDPVESVYEWHLTDRYHGVTNASTRSGTYRPHLEAVGRVRASLASLGGGFRGKADWRRSEWAALRSQIEGAITPAERASEAGLAPLYVARAMQEILPPTTRLTVDTGSHKMLFAQVWRTGHPLTYFNSNGLSSMGPGVPGAIALTLFDDSNPAVCVTGDGGFGMMVQELESVRRLGLSPLFVVFCDRSLSLIRIPHIMRGYEPVGVDLAPVDWAAVAEGFGIRGVWARTLSQVRQALEEWRDRPQATVLAVQIDAELYRGNNY